MNLPLPNPELATSFGRRAFLRRSGLAAFTAALAPMATSALFKATNAEGAVYADADILNFALNLEYLEGEYYSRAVCGGRHPPPARPSTTRGWRSSAPAWTNTARSGSTPSWATGR